MKQGGENDEMENDKKKGGKQTTVKEHEKK